MPKTAIPAPEFVKSTEIFTGFNFALTIEAVNVVEVVNTSVETSPIVDVATANETAGNSLSLTRSEAVLATTLLSESTAKIELAPVSGSVIVAIMLSIASSTVSSTPVTVITALD